jgi:hypothetical protein
MDRFGLDFDAGNLKDKMSAEAGHLMPGKKRRYRLI